MSTNLLPQIAESLGGTRPVIMASDIGVPKINYGRPTIKIVGISQPQVFRQMMEPNLPMLQKYSYYRESYPFALYKKGGKILKAQQGSTLQKLNHDFTDPFLKPKTPTIVRTPSKINVSTSVSNGIGNTGGFVGNKPLVN